MADKPQSFSEWIAQNKGQTAPAAPSHPVDLSQLTFKPQPGTAGTPQDPLSWLVDIISRPLYGVTNTVQSAVNRGVEANKKFTEGDLGGALGEVAQGIGGTALGGDFITGLLSTAPEHHRTFSDVIEQSTDKFGSLDPNYVDNPDNVDPMLKGALGLVGDIALDPLTWIPGAQIAKIGKAGIQGGKAIAEGISAGATVARDALKGTKAGEVVEKVLPKAGKPTVPEMPVSGGIANELGELPKIDSKASTSELTDPAFELPPSVGEQVRANPRAAKMVDMLDDLAKERPRAMPTTAGVAGSILDKNAWWTEYTRMASELPNYSSTLSGVKVGRATLPSMTFPEVTRLLRNPEVAMTTKKAVAERIESMYAHYKENFNKAQSLSKPQAVDALSRPLKPGNAKAAKPVETLVRQLDRYHELLAQDTASVEAAFGTGLSDQLRRILNPDKFDATVKQMGDILRSTDDLSTVTDLTGEPTLRKMFAALGIDPVATNAARRQAASNVGGPSVQDALEKMSDPKLGGVSQVDQDVLKSLPAVIRKNMTDLDSYEYATRTGILRTEEGIGEGLGRDERAMNTHFQWDALHQLTNRVTSRVGKMSPRPAASKRAAIVNSEAMPALLKQEELLDQHGFPFFFDYAGEKLPLSLGQSLETLMEDSGALMRQVLWNKDTAVPTTNLIDAIFFAVKKDAPWDVVNAQLAKTAKRNLKEGEITNPLAEGGSGRYGYVSRRIRKEPPADTADFRYVAKAGAGRGDPGGWYRVYDGNVLRAKLTDAIMRQVPRLKEIATQNAEAYTARRTAETLDLTEQQITELTALVSDPKKLGEALRTMGEVPSRIQKEAFEAGALKESSGLATVLTETAAPDLAITNSKATTKIADTGKAESKKAGVSGKKPKEQAKAIPEAGKSTAQKMFDEEADSANALTAHMEDTAFDPSGKERDWADSSDAYRSVKAGVMGKIDPLNKFFNARWGMEHIYSLLNDSGALHGNWTALRHAEMNRLNRVHGGFVEGTETPIIRQAFQDLQQGVRSSNPAIAAAAADLEKLVGELFDLSGEAPILGSTFFRNNVGLDKLNEMMEFKGLSAQFDLDLAARTAKENGTDLLTEASQQWKSWQVDDPFDFISRMDAAAMGLFTDYSVGQSFYRRAGREGWTSHKPQAGFSRIQNTDGSAYAAALPKNVYIRDDVLTELKRLEEVSRMSRQIDGEIGKFVNSYFDPIQSAWKKGITIYRPGHHIRNLIGDSSITFVAEGTQGLRKSITDAYKVMGLRNQYEGVDIAKALNELGEFKLPTTGEVISSGKFGDITTSAAYDAAERAGLFRSARVVEDYLDEVGVDNTVSRLAQFASLHGTGVERAAMGVSEYREHFSRLQHFLQIISKEQKKSSYKTLDEMLLAAADRVKRYHPDVSMLSSAEAKYMRRLIPFYSWFRGVLPAIVESTLAHPGRVSVFPKASFELAVMMGIDPNTLSDPFPDDQLFPSFLTDQVTGPQFQFGGDYFGINPGIAHLDVLNQFGADPVRGVAGMVSPLLRIPAELLSGGSWGTGAQIKDNSDYIDSSLPGINYLSNVTGTSVTGSLASMLQGKGLDPQYQVAAGNKGEQDQMISALNWLTGLGLNDQSRPNYINYAEIEKRNREGKVQSGF